MDNPAVWSLVETVRQLNEMARRARSGEPNVEDYLRIVSSDPVTEWFTGLLREKNEELEQERQRADRLARALRAWHAATAERLSANVSANEAELQLIDILREMRIIGL
jgi:hypothetical protein